MKVLSGIGLDGVDGFSNLGKHVGIKKDDKDLAVLYSRDVCAAAAVYTSNRIKGAPLYITRENLADRRAQAIVVNSGVANVATGEQGLQNARDTAAAAARELGVDPADVLVASTGVIGPQLPIDKLKDGLAGVKSELKPSGDFAEAIMTTDTYKKEICVEHQSFRIAGAAKGAGMIAPDMATMLAFIVTDADISGENLQQALRNSTDRSFNMMSVDMDTSTSDMAVIMASGQVKDVDQATFQQALDFVCVELAKLLARDGEGATKLIISQVENAVDASDARKIAKAVVASNLVKCAVYGNDPNWGRLMMAIGNSDAGNIIEEKINIRINELPIVTAGKAAAEFDEKELSDILKHSEEVTITIDMGAGTTAATAYGCDMSEEYIKINAEYTT